MKIKEYLNSGILESYLFGMATEAEVNELMELKEIYPEVKEAIEKARIDFDNKIPYMGELIASNDKDALKVMTSTKKKSPHEVPVDAGQLIDFKRKQPTMRIHKLWLWAVLIPLALLAIIFMAMAIYFYSKNQNIDDQKKNLELKIQEK